MSRPRFTIALIMMVTLIGCAAAAGAHYLVKGVVSGDRDSHFVFLLFSLAGPSLLLVIVACARALINRKG
jgi:hypothetical protein